MEAQSNYQAEITQLQAKLATLSTASQETEARIAAQGIIVASLYKQIDEVRLPQGTPDCEIVKENILRLTKQVEGLNYRLLVESQSYTNDDISLKNSIESEKSRHSALLEQTKSTLSIPDEDLNSLKAEISKISINAEALNNDLHLVETEKQRLETQYGRMEQDLKEISKLQHQNEQSFSQAQKKHKEEEETLLAELHALDVELKGFDQQIQQEKIQSSKNAAILKETVESASLKLKDELALREKITVQHSRLNALINEIAKQQTKTSLLDQRNAQLQQEIHGKETVVQQLKQTINSLRQDLKRQDERIKQQQKKNQKKNYKQLAAAAHRQYEALQKERERQQNILNNTIKTRSGYVSKDNLQILQRQLNRHSNPYASSLDSKLAESNKLQLRNKQFNDNIKRLKKISSEAEGKQQRALNETKNKRDLLTSSKLQIDKQINESTYKLNQYIKHFPNHEREVEQKRKQQRKVKRTISQNEQPASPPKREKKVKKEIKQEDFVILEDGKLPEQQPQQQYPRESRASQNFKKTKWYKRHSSHDLQYEPEKPLYQNRYFQAAALLFALLLIAIFNI